MRVQCQQRDLLNPCPWRSIHHSKSVYEPFRPSVKIGKIKARSPQLYTRISSQLSTKLPADEVKHHSGVPVRLWQLLGVQWSCSKLSTLTCAGSQDFPGKDPLIYPASPHTTSLLLLSFCQALATARPIIQPRSAHKKMQ